MSGAIAERDAHLSNFERLEQRVSRRGPGWISEIRRAAMARFAELGFPTPRDEEWKYTNVAPLARVPFRLAESRGVDPGAGVVKQAALPQADTSLAVFVDGLYAPDLSSLGSLPKGVIVGGLAEILDRDPECVEPHLARYASYEDHAFVALNTAFIRDGAFIRLPEGAVLDRPVQLLYVSTDRPDAFVCHPRSLIVAGENSQASIIESYVGLTDGVYFTNAVTEVIAGENAVIDHYKIQQESEAAFHIASLQVHQRRNSTFSSHSISLGGALARNDINAVLAAEGADCTLNGLFMVTRGQHVDHHTLIDHAQPHGSSRELYKGILAGSSTGVFDGRIVVRPDAQRTDARQTNKNLLLSEEAIINTKPQLEIFANDVKCSHGSTIGQLNEDALFYLRSRGLDAEAARELLTHAFASDIVGQMKLEPVRRQTDRTVHRWLPGSQELQEAT